MMLQTILMIGCLLMFSVSFAHGEIERVMLSLAKGECNETCMKILERKLYDTQDVAELQFNEEKLVLRWKPGRQFNYGNIYRLLKSAGIEVIEASVSVRGTLRHNNYNVTITSIGDNTPFVVLSPSETSEASENQSGEAGSQSPPIALQASTKAELIAAESQHKIVRIEGPLLQPERSSPLKIVALTITIPKSL